MKPTTYKTPLAKLKQPKAAPTLIQPEVEVEEEPVVTPVKKAKTVKHIAVEKEPEEEKIKEIVTDSGLTIQRGHPPKSIVRGRRNLKDLFEKLQVNDVVPVKNFKEAISMNSSMRYRKWKAAMAKQEDGTYLVQRIE
jgi:hypothetical protein